MSALNPSRVHYERVALRRAGYLPVVVRTGGKKPVESQWQAIQKARTAEKWEAFAAYAEAMNTGILTHGLCAVDIDVDDPATANAIQYECKRLLGNAPVRFRANSGRCLLLYRAPVNTKKVSSSGSNGKVEALSNGQQIVAFGQHESGVPYQWDSDLLSIPRDALNEVTADQVSVFFEAIRQALGASQDAPRQVQATVQPQQEPAPPRMVTERDRASASAALRTSVERLAAMGPGQRRNQALNDAALALGEFVGAGAIDVPDDFPAPDQPANSDMTAGMWRMSSYVCAELYAAAERNGYVGKRGMTVAAKTILSGLNAGIAKPRASLGMWEAASVKNNLPDPRKSSATRGVRLVSMDDIVEEETRWLWPNYLPSGMLTLLAGAGGTGKSTIAFSLAATVSTAGLWPDKRRCERAGNVIIWSGEDDLSRTIKPRLVAAGADTSRVNFVDGDVDTDGNHLPFDPATDIPKLRDAARQLQGGIALFIIDPIMSAITGDVNKAPDVRRSLQPFVHLASEFDCAVLGIHHFSKNSGGRNPADRVIGSQAITALARMVLGSANEEETAQHVITRLKSNISPVGGGFHYTIEETSIQTRGGKTLLPTRVVWGDAVQGSARAILADIEGDDIPQVSKRIDAATHFLANVLMYGPVQAKEVERQAKQLGIADRTLVRAKEMLNITSEKMRGDMSGVWVWCLPQHRKPVPSLLREMPGPSLLA